MVEASRQRLDHIFAAIADPTRRAILAGLSRGPATVTTIARRFPVSLNAVSKHLRVLERAGLIEREIRGREHRCHLAAGPLREASAWIETYRDFWQPRLDRLDRMLRTRAPATRARRSRS